MTDIAAPIVYLVTFEPTTSHWVVRNGNPLSSVAAYRERDQAFIAAQRAARANEPSRLVVQREDGAIELEWNYGKRPYVPRRKAPEALPSLM